MHGGMNDKFIVAHECTAYHHPKFIPRGTRPCTTIISRPFPVCKPSNEVECIVNGISDCGPNLTQLLSQIDRIPTKSRSESEGSSACRASYVHERDTVRRRCAWDAQERMRRRSSLYIYVSLHSLSNVNGVVHARPTEYHNYIYTHVGAYPYSRMPTHRTCGWIPTGMRPNLSRDATESRWGCGRISAGSRLRCGRIPTKMRLNLG